MALNLEVRLWTIRGCDSVDGSLAPKMDSSDLCECGKIRAQSPPILWETTANAIIALCLFASVNN